MKRFGPGETCCKECKSRFRCKDARFCIGNCNTLKNLDACGICVSKAKKAGAK